MCQLDYVSILIFTFHIPRFSQAVCDVDSGTDDPIYPSCHSPWSKWTLYFRDRRKTRTVKIENQLNMKHSISYKKCSTEVPSLPKTDTRQNITNFSLLSLVDMPPKNILKTFLCRKYRSGCSVGPGFTLLDMIKKQHSFMSPRRTIILIIIFRIVRIG